MKLGIAALGVLGLAFAASLVFDSPRTPSGPATWTCPEERAQLAGLHSSTASELPRDLRCADLRDAVLAGLDLTQRDLTGADLRGAGLWWVNSIQADVSDIRIGPVEAGVIQLPYLVVLAALALVVLTIVRRVRGVAPPGRAAVRVVLVVAGSLTVLARLFALAPLLAVEVLSPLLATAALLVLDAMLAGRPQPVSRGPKSRAGDRALPDALSP